MNADTMTYAENYKALSDIAEKAQNGLGLNDIDVLIPTMEQATGHYKALKDRIDKVEKMLGFGDSEE